MKFELMLSLKEITAINAATTMWNRIDRRLIAARLEKYYDLPLRLVNIHRNWVKIEDKVKAEIMELELPESVKEEVAHYVKPLGMEILKWCEFHCSDGYLDVDIPKEFYWTSRGTIDLKKTAEVLVRDESLCLTARYKLACIYCLEQNITELWHKMSQGCRAIFYGSEGFTGLMAQHELVTFWTLFKRGEIDRIRVCRRKNPYQFAFESAAVSGNIVATKYFWEKLTPREKETSVLMIINDVARESLSFHRIDFPTEFYAEVILFLFSQLKGEQQFNAFREHTFCILASLLKWPWHSFFLETINLIWDHISPRYSNAFLINILERAVQGHTYYDYPRLFTEFLQKCPLSHKKYITNSQTTTDILEMLFKTKDTRNIKLILDEMGPAKRKEYLYSRDGYFLCYEIMNRNDWDFLALLIRQCIPLREDLVRFKDYFSTDIISHKAYDHLISLLNSLIYHNGKRKGDEENFGNPSKKLAAVEIETAHGMEL